jgi:TetR/AcrR family transcriptional regulator, transcriptional repressor for nem operon
MPRSPRKSDGCVKLPSMIAPDRGSVTSGTRTRILDVAELLAQTRGYNGFSYADIAGELGLTKASLHYHFPGKAELGEALIDRYASRFAIALDSLEEQQADPREALEAYIELYAAVLRGDRMCLCGMLAAEYETLPASMQEAVIRFFDASEVWLEAVLDRGRDEGVLRFSGAAREEARVLIGGLEGAMLVARSYGDVTRFRAVADRMIAALV